MRTYTILTAKFNAREVNARDKKYKPIDTNVGYDQRDDTLVMDDFLSLLSSLTTPILLCCDDKALKSSHTHTHMLAFQVLWGYYIDIIIFYTDFQKKKNIT